MHYNTTGTRGASSDMQPNLAGRKVQNLAVGAAKTVLRESPRRGWNYCLDA